MLRKSLAVVLSLLMVASAVQAAPVMIDDFSKEDMQIKGTGRTYLMHYGKANAGRFFDWRDISARTYVDTAEVTVVESSGALGLLGNESDRIAVSASYYNNSNATRDFTAQGNEYLVIAAVNVNVAFESEWGVTLTDSAGRTAYLKKSLDIQYDSNLHGPNNFPHVAFKLDDFVNNNYIDLTSIERMDLAVEFGEDTGLADKRAAMIDSIYLSNTAPEPATMTMLLAGGVAALARRRKKTA